jgi:hypothetical protein
MLAQSIVLGLSDYCRIVKVTEDNITIDFNQSKAFHVGYQYGLLMGGQMTYAELKKMCKGVFTANTPLKIETLKNNVRTDYDTGDLLIFHSSHFDRLMSYFGLHMERKSVGIKDNQLFYLTKEFIAEFVHPSSVVVGRDKERPFILADAWKNLREYYKNDYLRNSDIAEMISSQIGKNTNQFNI